MNLMMRFSQQAVDRSQRMQTARQIIAIASGKGGVGKTWLSVTLGHALAQSGRRVILLDCDLGLANVDIQLGLMARHDIGSVLDGDVDWTDAIIRPSEGFDILAGRSGSGELAALGESHTGVLRRLISDIRAQYDLVLLDLGAGLDQFVRRMGCVADCLLVVCTSDPSSLTDAYAVLKLYQQDRAPRAPNAIVVINQAHSQGAGERTFATLAKATQSFLGFTPTLGAVIRRDEKVQDAIRHQTPLLVRHPGSIAGQDVWALAAAMMAATGGA